MYNSVKATSADNSHASTTFTVAVTDFDESDVTNPTDSDNDANTVAEDAANGAATQVTASASDADGANNAITYSVTAQSCSGAFAVDSSTGVVTATGSGLDYETADNHVLLRLLLLVLIQVLHLQPSQWSN